MSVGIEDLALATITEARARMGHALKRIRHCVDQLSEEQVWWRPHPSMNSIANLLLHLAGNLRQWLVLGIRQEPDDRDRPGEFADRSQRPKAELLAHLERTLEEVNQQLATLDGPALLEPRRIQGFELTVLGAMWDAIPHLSGHTQEVILLTRMQLGDEYRFEWAPSGPEEGAEG